MREVSDAFDHTSGNRIPGRPPTDPRAPMEKMTVDALRNRCRDVGYEEAWGTRTMPNGDSDAWTADQCRRVLAGNVQLNGRPRRMVDAGAPLKFSEYTRIDRLAELSARFGWKPPAGVIVGDAELAEIHRGKLREFAGEPEVPTTNPIGVKSIEQPVSTPKATKAPKEPKPIEPDSFIGLRRQARDMGIKVDLSWTKEVLKEVVRTGTAPAE